MNTLFEIDRSASDVLLGEAKQSTGEIPFRAPCLALDEFTKNGRRYPRKVVEAALAKITNSDGRTMFGSLGHKEKLEVPDVSHLIDRLWVDPKTNMLMCEGRILGTSKGTDLGIVLKAGKLGLSVKGLGTTKDLGEGKSEVTDDYRLVGVDFTLSPASPGAMASKANMYESAELPEISSELNEEQALCARIDEAVQAGLLKVEKKLRPLVEAELKKHEIEAVELVDDRIKEAETQVRFVLNEAVRSKIVTMFEDKPEIGTVVNLDEMTKNEKRNKAIIREARAAGSTLTDEEILAPLKK